MRQSSVLLIALLGGCISAPQIDPNPLGGDAPSRCKQQADQTVKVSGGVSAGFQKGLVGVEGEAGYEQIIEIQTQFDALQRDYAQLSYQLCEDSAANAISQAYYERRRECLDQWFTAMRSMQAALEAPEAKADTKELAWSLQGQMQWLDRIVTCGREPAQAPPVTATPVAQQPEIELTAYLVCQVQRDGAWVSVDDCDNTPLRENDRVKIGFRVNRPGRLYVLNYNETGLFQMMFPDPGISNELEPGRDYFLPPDDWFELDDQKAVTEHLQIIASVEKVPALEAQRGAFVEPTTVGQQPKEALKTRGLVEPFISRGFKKKKTAVTLEVGEGQTATTVPKVASGPGISVTEWRLKHE